MSKLLKSLLAATAFLTLAPTTAPALPLQCYMVCDSSSACDDFCAIGIQFTTCGAYGVCAGVQDAPSDEQASMTMEEPAPVCSETQDSATRES